MSDLSALRDNTFLKLAEVSGATFTAAEVDSMLNREYEHIQTLINNKNDEYFAKSVTTNTTTDELYSFPVDFLKMIQLELYLSDRWIDVPNIPVHKRETYANGNWNYIGRPDEAMVYYYILGSNYGLVPVRTSAGTNDLRLTYVYIPSLLLTDSDEPAIPSLYHELLEIGATNRLRRAIKEPPLDENDYQSKLNSLIETVVPRVKHRPKQIRMVRGIY